MAADEDKLKDQPSWVSDVSAFFDRLRGQDRLRVSDKLTVLNTPITSRETQNKLKLQSIVQYVRNKNYSRRHIEYFDEYRRMVATFPIIKGAIDIYSEEITTRDTDGNAFTIKCDDEKVKKLLETCFYKNLNMNKNAAKVAREMCKFGNVYAFIQSRPKDGVVELVFLPPDTMMREQMYDPNNLEAYRFNWYGGGGSAQYEPWEIVHWRNTEDIEMEPYGVSILRSIVDTWRRVVLIREALVIYRITRAPSKLLFKIGTDGMTGEEAFRFAQDMKKEVTKKPLVNPQTGEIDFKYNPLTIEENIYMPVYEGSPSDVVPIEGASNLDQVEDYKIIKDDLFAGLKIPKSWLSFEEDLSNKAALSEEDVRFAKTIQKHQADFVEGLIHIGIVHLFLNGCSQKEMESFTIEMNNPSTVSEKKKLELTQARLEISKAAWDQTNPGLNLMSYVDVLREILKFTDDEIKQTIKSQFGEKKIFWRLSQLYQAGTYDEPDVEKRLAQLKQMGGIDDQGETEQGFENLIFENSTLKGILRRKIDEELTSMFPTIGGSPSAKQIRILTGTLTEQLQNAKKDFE